MSEPLRILNLEDDPVDAELVDAELRRAGLAHETRRAQTEGDFLLTLEEFCPDVILADYSLPSFTGRRALDLVRERDEHLPFIFVSGTIGDDVAVDAIKGGATDYLMKDRLSRLVPAIERAVRDAVALRRKEAVESALRESEARYRALFEGVPVGIYRSSPSGEILEANPKLVEILGFPSRESLLAVTANTCYADPATREVWKFRLEREDVVTMELEHVRPDGARIWVIDTAHAVRDQHGNVAYYEGMLRDITDVKRAGETVQRMNGELQALIDASPAPIVSMRTDGIVTGWSRAAEQMFGWTQEEILGKPYPIVPPEKEEEYKLLRNRIVGGEVVRGVEVTRQRKDGSPIELLLSGAPLHDASGKTRGLITVLVDVTERRAAREALRENEARFRLIAENAKDIIYRYRIDPEPGYDYISPSVETVAGYTPQEFYDDPILFQRISHPDDLPRIIEMFGDGEAFERTYTTRWITKDGKTISCESQNTPIRNEDGAVVGFVGIIRDVTEQIRAEEELRASFERLQRTDDERRRLLAQVVKAQEEERRRIAEDIHDDSIQIVASAGLRIGVLARQLTDPEQRESLQRLEATVHAAIGRLRSLMFALRPPALDREGLVAAIRMYLDEVADGQGPKVALQSGLDGDPPAETRAIVYRIFQEAMVNIRKHARASNVRIELEQADGYIGLRVRDDGVGFDVEAARDSVPGHLGLVSMRERAELAGGKLAIETAPGNGTTLEAWVPFEAVAKAAS